MVEKNILILSYFFPPCNLTASNRPLGWAKYLNQFGYRPTIITRNWNTNIEDPVDLHKASGIELEYHKFDSYDLILVPFKPTFRDRLYTKENANTLEIFLRKFLTINELLLQNFFWFATPHKSIYENACVELSKDKYQGLIVTGNPFIFFKFGHYLSKKFKIKWFADYRDDWSTADPINKWYNNLPIINIIGNVIEKRSEKKWLSNAAAFFSISENYVNKIGKFIRKPGNVVYNGFIKDDFSEFNDEFKSDEFTVCFSGTLIGIQPIEIFIDAYKKLIRNYENKIKLKIVFIGTKFQSEQGKRLKKLLLGFEDNVEITKRISHKKAIEMQAKANLLLLVSFTGINDAPGSKIFDYLGLQKPILLCPSDNGIMEKIATSTNQAIICNTSDEVYLTLNEMIEKFILNKSPITRQLNLSALNFYTRQNQTKIMADTLNKYIS